MLQCFYNRNSGGWIEKFKGKSLLAPELEILNKIFLQFKNPADNCENNKIS